MFLQLKMHKKNIKKHNKNMKHIFNQFCIIFTSILKPKSIKKRHQNLIKKKHSNFYGNRTYSQRSRGSPAGYAIAARELRKDQNQEFFRISRKTSTRRAPGARRIQSLRAFRLASDRIFDRWKTEDWLVLALTLVFGPVEQNP